MPMPSPSPEHRALERLAGAWRGEEEIAPSPFDPQGARAEGLVTNTVVVDGFAVQHDYVQLRDGVASFRGHGVFRWAPERQAVVLWWIDAMGGPPTEYVGGWVGDELVLEAPIPGGFARSTWVFDDAGRYAHALDVSPDGAEWMTTMRGRYHRA
ncbi:MAG: DUF1579 family protein [Gemmatimonadales bacterium]|nr:DUF1579 family protein [Gemmatimonadales bacterium]